MGRVRADRLRLRDQLTVARNAPASFPVQTGDRNLPNPNLNVTASEILTVSEVADRLRCSKAHVCNVINGRVKGVAPLPAIRLGRRMLVRVAALEAWLLQSEDGVL